MFDYFLKKKVIKVWSFKNFVHLGGVGGLGCEGLGFRGQ